MEQLILHLAGDYVTQTDWMARNKDRALWPAACHALVYGLPFLVIGSPRAVLAIVAGHLIIDRFGLARYVLRMKCWLGSAHTPGSDCLGTGLPKDMPEWRAWWLLVAVDNTMHLALNYAALRWL
jgi:hypothetical protein